eukprot:g11098.t1
MAQPPVPPQGYPQPLQPQQQQQFPGQPSPGTMNMGTPGTVLPNGQFVPNMNMPGTPGTVLPNGQFVPNVMPGTPGAMNLGTPGTAVLPSGQVVPAPAPMYTTAPPVYAPSPGTLNVRNVGEGAAAEEPVIARGPQEFVGVPPGMTRESMQPGYDPRRKVQKRMFNPAWSIRDSWGNRRDKKCCTIS